MQRESASKVVRKELFLALCNLTTALVMFPLRHPDGWPIAVAAAVVSGAFFFAADRSHHVLPLLVCGVLLAGGFVAGVLTDALSSGAIPWILLGVGSVFALNRIVFGLVRPVPAPRRQRQR